MDIVLDTNIYLASLFTEGLCWELIELTLGPKSQHSVFISLEIWSELEQTIKKKKLIGSYYLSTLEKTLKDRCILVQPKEKINVVARDQNDNKILECAVAAQADLIISMDKDLLKLKHFRKIGIVHPKTFYYMLPKTN